MNPNSILHLSIFVHLCEAFLGIQPHWNLFCYLFHLKPQPDSNNPSRIGGYGLQLNQGQGSEYLAYSTPTSLSGWKIWWFYIGNHAPTLPRWTIEAPVKKDCWKSRVSNEELPQVRDLLEKIRDLKDVGVTSATIMLSWLWRRIQPLQQRAHFGYQYAGISCDELALRMLRRAFLEVETLPAIPELYSADKPPAPMSSWLVLEYFSLAFCPFFSDFCLLLCRNKLCCIRVILLVPSLLVRIVRLNAFPLY